MTGLYVKEIRTFWLAQKNLTHKNGYWKHTHTHTHTHTITHKCTCVRTHTHTHTHTCSIEDKQTNIKREISIEILFFLFKTFTHKYRLAIIEYISVTTNVYGNSESKQHYGKNQKRYQHPGEEKLMPGLTRSFWLIYLFF